MVLSIVQVELFSHLLSIIIINNLKRNRSVQIIYIRWSIELLELNSITWNHLNECQQTIYVK